MAFRLLALDGGGIRGYMTARIMHRLEQDAGVDLTAKAVVDGYSGTSTGGLLAIGLANDHTPAKLAQLYKDKAQTIFEPNRNREVVWVIRQAARFVPGLLELIEGVGIFSSQYVADGLHRVCHDLVGDAVFGDFDPDRVLAVNTAAMKIPGTVEGWTSTTMCNHPLSRSRIGDSRRIKQLDGALSTSAAPSYFPPHKVVADGTSLGFFADGGLFANNPVMNGIAVAIATEKADLQDMRVLSIGTGIDTTGIPQQVFRKPRGFGILEWLGLQEGVPAGALLNITMTASADNMTWVSGNLLGDSIVRLNPRLPRPVPLDGISARDFATMDAAVDDLVQSERWPDAVAMVQSWNADPG